MNAEPKIPRGFIKRMNEIGAPRVESWKIGRLSLNEAVRRFLAGKLVLLVHEGKAELCIPPKENE